ncbi:hypothetical protein GJAV_G00194640 [Gymnothorax javanicus]|nr:hypothetical protein GJAV_G00194640 [Gymnothorax javanicus]
MVLDSARRFLNVVGTSGYDLDETLWEGLTLRQGTAPEVWFKLAPAPNYNAARQRNLTDLAVIHGRHAGGMCWSAAQPEYRRLKALSDPTLKIRDLLDCIIQKGHGHAETFLNFLKEADTRKTFPQLSVVLEPLHRPQERPSAKRKSDDKLEEISGKKQKCEAGSRMVTEKQMMLVARVLGRDWKQLGRVVLQVPSVKLEQIEEENPGNHTERVFAMLRTWRSRERHNATAARLHELLSADECGPPPNSIDFLLEDT